MENEQKFLLNNRNNEIIQTHNAVSIGASGNAFGIWNNCAGYEKIAVTLFNDSATASLGSIEWSFDGTTQHSNESGVIPNNSNQKKSGITDIKAPYFRLVIANQDAVSHTMSAWAYLKA